MDDTNTQILAAIEIEIANAKKRLDFIYSERMDEEGKRSVAQADSSRLEKYASYLDDINAGKDAEIADKTTAIASLDLQISNKNDEIGTLNASVTSLGAEISDKTIRLQELNQEITDTQAAYDSRNKEIEQRDADSQEKNGSVTGRLDKIQSFIQEML